ncbi:MAG: hypothetical protein V3V70_00370 [Candidatus Scalindua sp.]
MKYDYFNIEDQARKEWENLCPPNEYRVIQKKDFLMLPGVLPSELTNKYESIFVMASGDGVENGIVYYMANGNRLDYKDNTIDQQPFGLAFIDNTPIPSGCLIQHGDWEGRTTRPPKEFWDKVSKSEVGQRYPLSELPEKDSGSINDINIKSQNTAFSTLVKQIEHMVKNDY